MIGRNSFAIGSIRLIDGIKHGLQSIEPVLIRRFLIDYGHQLYPSLKTIALFREIFWDLSSIAEFSKFRAKLFERLPFENCLNDTTTSDSDARLSHRKRSGHRLGDVGQWFLKEFFEYSRVS